MLKEYQLPLSQGAWQQLFGITLLVICHCRGQSPAESPAVVEDMVLSIQGGERVTVQYSTVQ